MHLPTLAEISPLLMNYGYLMFFVLSVFEGPIITVIAGSLVGLGYFNFWIIYAISVLGDLLGDLLYYSVGRWGSGYLRKRGRFMGVSLAHVEKIETHFADHAGKTLTFGKLTHAVGAAILIAAGMAKIPLKKFLWLNFLGTLPKVLIFVLVGYYFGQAYQQIDHYFNYAVFATFIGILLLVGMYFFVKKFREKVKIG